MWNSDSSVPDNNYPLFIYSKVEKEVKDPSIPGGMLIKNTKGIAILLFAILLQLCSSGMELLTLGVGVVVFCGALAVLTWKSSKTRD